MFYFIAKCGSTRHACSLLIKGPFVLLQDLRIGCLVCCIWVGLFKDNGVCILLGMFWRLYLATFDAWLSLISWLLFPCLGKEWLEVHLLIKYSRVSLAWEQARDKYWRVDKPLFWLYFRTYLIPFSVVLCWILIRKDQICFLQSLLCL